MVKSTTGLHFGFMAIEGLVCRPLRYSFFLEGDDFNSPSSLIKDLFSEYSCVYSKPLYERVKSEFAQQCSIFEALHFSPESLFQSSIQFLSCNLHLLHFTAGHEVIITALWALALCADLGGDGPLTHILSSPETTEVAFLCPQSCWVESAGSWRETDFPFPSWKHLEMWLLSQSSRVGAELYSSRGFSDFALGSGSRVHVAFSPVTRGAGNVTIRCHRARPWSLAELSRNGMMDSSSLEILLGAIERQLNILIVGATSTGKTTLLSALLEECGASERLIVLEDVPELHLSNPHVVYLQSRGTVASTQLRVTLDDLVREALRMRPDRLIIGECRGPEAYSLLQALHTGHRGSLCTLHGNSVEDALDRFQALVLQGQSSLSEKLVERMIASSIDLAVLLKRDQSGRRYVADVRFVNGGRGGVE